VPIYDILYFIIQETQRDGISTRANSVAFSFFLAIFPTIIFAFTLIPLLPYSEYYVDTVNQAIQSALPASASSYLTGVINDIASIKRGGLLSIGVLLSVFFASSGMLTLMIGFDKSYDTFKKRSYLRKRVVALALTLLLVVLLIVSIVLIIIGQSALDYVLNLMGIDLADGWLAGLRLLSSTAIVYTGITVIYKYGPSLMRRTKFFNAGAIVATAGSILTSVGFSYFVNNFGRYNELYGSIGALIVILLWLQFNATILLIGFELNAAIAVNRDLRATADD
jgi:membrane protein